MRHLLPLCVAGTTHFVVRQPDGAIDVGVDVDKMAQLKASAGLEAAAQADHVNPPPPHTHTHTRSYTVSDLISRKPAENNHANVSSQ